LFGLLLLLLVFWEFYRKPVKWINWIGAIVLGILVIGFLFHTLGIGLRWYVAGRAPLSNGFETMIYIAWTTMLAGLLFHRRNKVVLPATALLATVTLFVAHLSWMDPEITNLVPVLKSYWLTIHVAVVTASYGFLGMGAILALFNLALMTMAKPTNRENILVQITDTTLIIEIVLIVGLYLLTIGSFLGAIWANESWGRYWGWDPKETWAFITILVYTFIIHIRQIPSLSSLFIFNFSSALGITSVLMTYFGVNYYLSGLHSYAGGDALPFPRWIFLAVVAFFALSILAWYKLRNIKRAQL
jgi:cytochrome c-type biogenesis protein CcsB